MYEHRNQALLSPAKYYRRVAGHILIAVSLIGASLAIGITGYHFVAHFSWLDSLHNAAMILSGMGLVDPVRSQSGKWFSSFYALFSGIIFITNFGIILAPAAHRIFHRLHLGEK